jgi:DNA-directed RNA polymerase subunit RPC12/RpoP
MAYQCSRCGRSVEKLVPIDDAYRSAEESATWSGLLETPWPQTYTEYVCVTCARQILGISDDDLIREERLTRIETEFQINLLKGRLSQVVIEAIFQEFGYEVYPYGYESYLTNIIKSMRKGNANISVRKLRATPDLIVYDRELNEGFFLEVKATNTPDETKFWISKPTLQNYTTYWPEAILVVYCIPSMNTYCRQIKDISPEQLQIEQGPITSGHETYLVNLQSEFLSLPQCFRLIEADRYQDFCQRIRGVLKNFHQPTD